MLFAAFLSRIWTTSFTRTRTNGPGTVPPKVQKVYCTPSASVPFTSVVSRLTITFALPGRSTGGGTSGAEVRIAATSGIAASPAVSRAWLCQVIITPISSATVVSTAPVTSPLRIARPPLWCSVRHAPARRYEPDHGDFGGRRGDDAPGGAPHRPGHGLCATGSRPGGCGRASRADRR